MVYDPQKYDYAEYSKRYYAKKKGEINAKRKTKRDQFKERMKHLEERVARCIVEQEEDDSPQPEYERRNGKPYLPLATVLAGFEISGYFETAGNRRKNKSDIRTAWRLLGEPVDFFPLFSRLVQVRTAFENGKQLADPTQKYSLSSQLGMVQAFTNITNVFKDLDLPPETMRDLNRLYKLYKLRADRREIEQFTNNKEPILSYPEYLAEGITSGWPSLDRSLRRKTTRPRTGS
jgi:hypothetical protein